MNKKPTKSLTGFLTTTRKDGASFWTKYGPKENPFGLHEAPNTWPPLLGLPSSIDPPPKTPQNQAPTHKLKAPTSSINRIIQSKYAK